MTIRERDERISDLAGQLYDPDGNHLAEQNTELRKLVCTLNQNLQHAALAPGWSASKGTEPYLLRPQFDLIYTF